jgi:hypothetical protein
MLIIAVAHLGARIKSVDLATATARQEHHLPRDSEIGGGCRYATSSLVDQWNSVPLTHMRRMMTGRQGSPHHQIWWECRGIRPAPGSFRARSRATADAGPGFWRATT